MVLPGSFTGPLAAALGEVDVAWIVGLVVTAVAYLLFSRSLDRGAEHAAEESSEARLGHAGRSTPVSPDRSRRTPPRSPGSPSRRRSPGCRASPTSHRADVAVLGVPFDSGVSYRPGARFGPAHVRASSKLLRPFHPALGVAPFGVQQVADAGDVAVNPFDIVAALATIERRERRRARHRRDAADPRRRPHDRPALLRSVARDRGPVAVLHFDAHLDTWDTYFGAPYTHGTPFRRAAEEGLLDPRRCLHVGIRGPLYGADDLAEDRVLGFQVIGSDDYQTDGLAAVVERMRARLGDGPVYVSIDIDVLDPAHAPGTGTPEAGGLTSRELLHTLRGLVGRRRRRRRRRRGRPGLRPRRDHRDRRGARRVRAAGGARGGPGRRPSSVVPGVQRHRRQQRQRDALAAQHPRPQVRALAGEHVVGQGGHDEPVPARDLARELARVPPGVAGEDPHAAHPRGERVRVAVEVHQRDRAAHRDQPLDPVRAGGRRAGSVRHRAVFASTGPPTNTDGGRDDSGAHAGSTSRSATSLGRLSTTPRLPRSRCSMR